MNKVILIGNLTRDPELTETTSGIKICRFSIAVGRNYSGADGEKKTDFFNIVAWRGLGENVARYCRKGSKVCVSGSIELRNYEDSQGVKRTGVDIIAQDVEFLSTRTNSDGESATQPNDYVAPPQQQSMYGKKPQLQPFDDDSDIPF